MPRAPTSQPTSLTASRETTFDVAVVSSLQRALPIFQPSRTLDPLRHTVLAPLPAPMLIPPIGKSIPPLPFRPEVAHCPSIHGGRRGASDVDLNRNSRGARRETEKASAD